MSENNHVCNVCSAEFEVISDLVDADEHSVQFCPFCGSELEEPEDLEDPWSELGEDEE